MKYYENMTIGMTVDKSEAKNSSEQIHIAPTPYLKTSKSFRIKPSRRPRSLLQKILNKCREAA